MNEYEKELQAKDEITTAVNFNMAEEMLVWRPDVMLAFLEHPQYHGLVASVVCLHFCDFLLHQVICCSRASFSLKRYMKLLMLSCGECGNQ